MSNIFYSSSEKPEAASREVNMSSQLCSNNTFGKSFDRELRPNRLSTGILRAERSEIEKNTCSRRVSVLDFARTIKSSSNNTFGKSFDRELRPNRLSTGILRPSEAHGEA